MVPHPEDITIGTRIWLVIAIIIAGLLLLFAVSVEGQTQSQDDITPYDWQITQIQRKALESAYQHQIEALFATWMKDSTGQPDRAARGARNARRAFIAAIREIEKWEEKIEPSRRSPP